MRIIFFVLALLIALAIAAAAVLNNQAVDLNYYISQASLPLWMLILGSAIAGALVIIFYNIFHGIHKYMKLQGERNHKEDLLRRVKLAETEKEKLQAELSKLQKEREDAGAKENARLADEKIKLEEQLSLQQKDREDIIKNREDAGAKENARLADEKIKLEEQLSKQQKDREDAVKDRYR